MSHPIESVEEFYAHALAIEREAADRYVEFAEWFGTRNDEIATLCRRLATLEQEHFNDLAEACARLELPEIADGDYHWLEKGSPEAPARELFYRLATPRQLLEVALAAEKRAHGYFVWAARTARDRPIRELASVMAAEEHEHIAWVKDALKKLSVVT
jgi:rubrerythrin